MTAAALRRAVPAVWAAAGVAWTAYWVRFGPGMTADTMDYLGIGRAPFALHPDVFQWPPVFWLLLQLGRAVGLAPWTGAVLVMCAARGLLAGGAYRLGRGLAGAWAGHLLALFSFVWVPLTYAALYCLSDALFLGCMLWWLASARAVRANDPHVERRVWQTTAWATFMVSTRFVGLPLAFVEWIVAAIALRAAGNARWMRTTVLTGACIVAPPALWAGLGAMLSGDAVGAREPARHALSVHLANVGTGWWDPMLLGRHGDVFWGDRGAFAGPGPFVQAGLYWCALLLVWMALQPREGSAPWWRARLTVQAVLYLAMLVAVSARVWIDPIGPRFLLPVVFLAAAACCHRRSDLALSRWSVWGFVALVAGWTIDSGLAGRFQPRFGSLAVAVVSFGAAAVCLVAVGLDPTPRRPARWAGPAMSIACAAVLCTQALWSRELLSLVARGGLPSVQHPGWRTAAEVEQLRNAVATGDTIYTHTPEAVRAILDDRRDVTVEPLCFRRLDPDCEPTLEEYVAAFDKRSREHAEWIVLLQRVSVPYLFSGELAALAADRPHVEAIQSEQMAAYRWPPRSMGRPPGVSHGE